ncbi:MAG: cobalamin-dependent protein [Thermodesulfobacteriota bacterium]|nr:cobalamin-dependent protein [Thermodesulfobacteriota bacterium]
MGSKGRRIRVLLTKSHIDGHDRGIRYIARRLTEAGMEIILTRYRTPEDVVNCAMEEDVDVIGMSFSVGGHIVITEEVIDLLKNNSMSNILVIVGGIISEDEEPDLLRLGVGKTFGPGSYAEDVILYIQENISC